jgi:hypothetical protein
MLGNVYFTKFESILKYGIIFWGGSQKENQMIFKIQKKCLRLIKRVNNGVSCRGLFSDFGILTVVEVCSVILEF